MCLGLSGQLVKYVMKLVCQGNTSRACIVIRLEPPRSVVRVPTWTRKSSLLRNVRTGPGGHPTFSSVGTGVISRW